MQYSLGRTVLETRSSSYDWKRFRQLTFL